MRPRAGRDSHLLWAMACVGVVVRLLAHGGARVLLV